MIYEYVFTINNVHFCIIAMLATMLCLFELQQSHCFDETVKKLCKDLTIQKDAVCMSHFVIVIDAKGKPGKAKRQKIG